MIDGKSISKLCFFFLCFSFSILNPISSKAISDKDISINWECSYQNASSDIKCANFSQRIQFFQGGRVLLQDNGFFCNNENRLNRITYDAFMNKTTRGSFLCKTNEFDFVVHYQVKLSRSKNKLSYKITGKVSEATRNSGQISRQNISYSTSVDVQFDGNRCKARRTYQLKETIGGIPKRNILRRYIGRKCST